MGKTMVKRLIDTKYKKMQKTQMKYIYKIYTAYHIRGVCVGTGTSLGLMAV